MIDRALRPVIAVGGVVFAPGPSVLLVRRGNPPMLGAWTLPGGRLLGGEAISRGIEREVLEETGLNVSCRTLIEIVEIMTEGYHYVIHDHLCVALDPSSVPVAGDDAAEARFVPISELADFGVSEAVARVVQKGFAMQLSAREDA